MAGPDEPRGRQEGRSDDLFDDLDRFFASIDESEWPEPQEGSPSAASSSGRPEARGPEGGPSRARTGGPEDEGDRMDRETGPAPPSPEPPTPEPPEQEEEPSPPEPTESPESGLEPSPTREMTTADWARLRDVLGEEEEEEEEELPFVEVPTELSPEESLFGYPSRDEEAGLGPAEAEAGAEEALPGAWETGPAEESHVVEEPGESTPEPGGLTLEDLKKAPPEYRDLPGEEESVEELEGPGVEVPSAPPPPASPEDAQLAEPSLADVEAAADQLAEEFGEAPGGVEEDLLTDLGAPEPRRTVKVGEPESMLGPAWEEPTSQTVSTEQAAPVPERGRNLPAAVITGAGLVVAGVIFVFISKALFVLLAGAVVLFGQLELYTTMQRRDYQPATALGLVLGGFTMAAAYLRGEQAMLFMLAMALVLSFLWYMAAPPKARVGALANIGATLLGLAYGPFLAGYALVILAIPDQGRSLMLAVLGLTFLNDIAAFAIGSVWGSRPLAPTISPRKSVEGLVGSSLLTVVLGIAFVPSIDGMTLVRAVELGLVVSLFGPLGDLAESLLKRDLGVKDMGTVLPGHGGVLDRIDSALFVAPAAFYLFRLIL